ncbi:MAG: polyprenyl synthetase family protein [Candidatus Bathyarchaeia archaeon]|nr:polyprenyl synthetase family protein [Candidatus Bathyarchaeota archaeon]
MSEKAVRKILAEIERLGRESYEIAKEVITKEKFEYTPLNEALNYFMQGWRNFHHPALLAIACKAVGGKPEKTTLIGAALVLLTGAADIHDDVIDESKVKNSKATVYGKFGKDLSIVAGDVLFIQGLTILSMACGNLNKKQREDVQRLIKQGFFELGDAESEEVSFKGNWNIDPEKYLRILTRKATIAEVAARVGALIGGATSKEVEEWGRIGRLLGLLMNIRNEFVDIFEVEEIRNRRDNECLPLPVLYAISNEKSKEKIIHLLKKKELTDDDTANLAEIVLETDEVQKFKNKVHRSIEDINKLINKYKKKCKEVALLQKLTKLALSDL